jgi:hypothetical protein
MQQDGNAISLSIYMSIVTKLVEYCCSNHELEGSQCERDKFRAKNTFSTVDRTRMKHKRRSIPLIKNILERNQCVVASIEICRELRHPDVYS